MYIVSSCLLGVNCKYSGGNNRNQAVIDFLKGKEYIEVCPEVAGGLSTPRPPCEYASDGSERIVNIEGVDVTENFVKGAEKMLEKVYNNIDTKDCKECVECKDGKDYKDCIEGAILKANSPSCGNGIIYDGTFSGKKIKGDGCFVRLLKKEGIKVVSEKEIEKYGKF